MTDLATLGLRFETQGAERAEKTLDNLASKADRAERATDGLAGGSRRLSGATMQMLASIERAVQELVQLQRAQQQFVVGLAEGAAAAVREAQALNTASGAMNAYGASATKAAAAQNVVAVSSRRAAAGTGLAGHEMLNFGRQMSDVGMMLALGQSPFMVLLQQGPQVADIFQTAKMRGVSFGQAMGSVFGAIRPFVPLLVGVGTAAAVAFGGAALAARAVNKDVGDLSKGLGLTEAQMKRLKDEGVNTGVTIGDVFKGTFNYIAGAVGKTLEPVAKWFSKLFDDMTRWAVAGVKGIVGALVGGFYAIRAIWKQLPAVMGDLAVSAANAVINAVERMINRAIDGYNKVLPIIKALMLATGNVGGALGLREGQHVNWGDIQNRNAGAAAGAIDAGRAAFDEGRKAGEGWVDGVGKGLKDAWLKAAEDRIKAAAGDAGAGRKARERAGPKGPSAEDMAEQFAQRRADIERQIEQAKMEELQAQLALTHGISERADIEREISRQQAAVKAAQLQSQLERIKADDKLTDAAKQELAVMLLGVAIRQGNVARMQQEAIDAQERRDQARQELDLAQARMDAEIDLLESRAALAKSSFSRAVIEVEILRKQQRAERERLGRITELNGYSKEEVARAKARLGVIDEIHANELAIAQEGTTLYAAMEEATSAVRGFKDAFKRGDWAGLLNNLRGVIETIQASFATQGMGGGIMTLGSVAAQVIGGKTGRAIGGGLSIAGGMAGLGSLLSGGGLAAGVANGIVGLGGSAALAGGVGSAIMGIGSVLGPIGLAAGALYAAAKLFNLGGKPSNQGAGYDLITGQFSGNKRTQETEDAARAAGDAIKAIQEGLKASGIELNDAVRGLVIGTRDLSQIYLTSGKTLTSAVGDSAAAVDAALRALLESATFASDAQRQVAMAALAAGGGFEAVAAALDKYAQAQQISANLADEILRLTDPKAYDIQAVTRAIEEQRKAAKALADEGFLAADQLATINDQLSTLERLQLDEVMKRYTDAVDGAAEALRKAKEYSDRIFQVSRNIMAMDAEIRRLKGDTAGAKAIQRQLELERTDPLARDKLRQLWAAQDLAEARERLVEAHRAASDAVDSLIEARDRAFEAVEAAEERVISLYQRSVDELVRTADRLKDMVARIRDYRMGLNVSQGTPATSYLAARNEFLRISAAARGGDEDAIGKLTGVSDEFLQASLAYHTDSIAYLKDLAAVKTAAAATEQLGEAQLTENEKQRKLLEKQIDGLVTLDKGLDDLETAIGELLSARQAAEIADREAQAAQAQLQAMEGQIGQLVTLNQGVVSVQQRLVELRGALNALSQLQGGGGGKGGGGGTGVGWAPDPWEVVDGVHIDPSNPNIDKAWNPNNDWMSFDEVTGKRINLGLGPNNLPLNLFEGWRDVHPGAADWMDPAAIADAREAWLAQQAAERAARNARVHDLATGTTEEALEFQRKYVDPFRNLPGFATGGEIMVGGSGGPDSQLVSLWASPNESIQIRRPDQRDDTAEEVRALRSTVERLEKALIAITVNSGKAARAIDSIERDGVYARGPDPDAPVVTEAA